MNYGKKSTSKKRGVLISRTSMLGQKAHVSLVRLLLIGLMALAVSIACIGIGAYRGVIDNTPNVDSIDIMPLGYATFLYDQNGTKLRKLSAADSNRLPVSLSQIPINLQHAVVAIEDERFYEHNGIDVKGILRAATKAVTSQSLSEGASTITQQLLKNNVFTGWTSESTWLERITRKLQEQFLAVQIEEKISKDVILENYLNTINLGAGCYGVQAAAQQYFNKDVSQLTLSECVTLAGITQNPTRFNPIQHPEDNAKRRKEVLQHMLDQNYIDKAQYDEALKDDVYSRIQLAQAEISQKANTVYSYYEDELIDQIIKDLMNIKGYTKSQATDMVYSGGLSIYSTQDARIQQILDEEYANEANFPAEVKYELEYALTVVNPKGEQVNYSKEMLMSHFRETDSTFDLLFDTQEEAQSYVDAYKNFVLSDGSTVFAERINFAPQPQSSVSIIDQSTGQVLALVGGRGKKTASLTLNRATDTTRQPGSTFKIVSTYAPALDVDNMTLATTFVDEEYYYPNGLPVNNYAKNYSGEMTIRRAIQESCNVVAVKCLEEVTPAVGLKYLDNFGFTTLAHGYESDRDARGDVWSDENLATALGGITRGVTNVELCAAYASIANGGKYIRPIYYTKILDHNGNILIENPSISRTVLKETTAYLLTSAMEGVIKNGTGKLCQLGSMPVAGKTGTTEEYNDLWFVGYTPYYTCAIWSGYDYNEKIPEDQRDYHKVLWQKIMTRLHQGLPSKDFKRPSKIIEVPVCEISGLLPMNGCPTIMEHFEDGTEPVAYCYGHFGTFFGTEEDESDSLLNGLMDPNNPNAMLPEGNTIPTIDDNNGGINDYIDEGVDTEYGGNDNSYDSGGGNDNNYDTGGGNDNNYGGDEGIVEIGAE